MSLYLCFVSILGNIVERVTGGTAIGRVGGSGGGGGGLVGRWAGGGMKVGG